MNIVEKRVGRRVTSKLPILLMNKDNPDIVNTVLSFNISVVGICLQTDISLQSGEQVELELPTSFGKLKLQAVIVWNRLNEYGCNFVGMDSADKRILQQWLFPPFEP